MKISPLVASIGLLSGMAFSQQTFAQPSPPQASSPHPAARLHGHPLLPAQANEQARLASHARLKREANFQAERQTKASLPAPPQAFSSQSVSNQVIEGHAVDKKTPQKRQAVESLNLMSHSAAGDLQMQADSSCDELTGLNGQALVDALSAATPACVGAFYSLVGSQATASFSQANVLAVANAIDGRAESYTGTDIQGLESLINFVRAALYVQFYHPEDVPAYDASVTTALSGALDSLFNNPKSWTVSEANAGVLKEALILVDSANLGAEFNWVTIKVLNEYDSDWQALFGMNAAANAVFTTLFRAQWNDEMQALFARDQSILDALNQFQLEQRQLQGTNAEYLLVNAVREMSRLYYIETMKPRVTTLVKAVIDSSSKEDSSRAIWLAAAEMADYYDRSQCDYYGICGFKYQLEQDTLSFNWKCSDTLKMRAQDLYQDQASWICEVLSGQEAYFHSKLETGNTPVSEDNNDDLELVIFNSSGDYQSFAGSFFGINTDNGGMYLEGSPAGLKNQARFIAYEAEWRRPDFHVWNLQHEYVHYLDGRFNLHGDFARGMSADTIWWVEGLAEYISYRDANTAAIALGETKAFALSQIFKNTYDSGQDRVYRWGYLAVRFMFERHMDDVRQILSLLRSDNYSEYQALIDGIGSRYDNEWYNWLTSGLSTADNGIVDKGPSDIDAAPSGREGNWSGPGGNISRDFAPCTVSDESYRYQEGMTPLLDVPIECIDSKNGRASLVFANEQRSDQELWIKVGDGWGDADIYFSSQGWASAENNEGLGIGNGNHEVIKVRLNPDSYWHYLTLAGEFGGVDLLLSTTEVEADPDPAQGGGDGDGGEPVDCGAPSTDYGQLQAGKNECLSGGRSSFYVWVEEDNTRLTFSLGGGTGDADLYYAADTWAGTAHYDAFAKTAGNSETLTVTANRGWRYLAVESDSQYAGVSLSLKVATAGEPLPSVLENACATKAPQSYSELQSGAAICAASGRGDFYFYVAEGTQEIEVVTGHGSGDVSLYGGTSWPTANSYQQVSTQQGNAERLLLQAPSEGWYYLMLDGANAEGVSIQMQAR
ncbi:M9 family metallopeptidase [Shewanella algae]|nr:M9 family metallopeptidase [Shewanella algae]MDO8253149.1 M9 family metallopeptidase [Shewanella algae]